MSNSDVDKFLAQMELEGKTKLNLWESQIFELLAKKASYETIKRFLAVQNVEANRSSIAEFVKAKKRSKLYAQAMGQRNSYSVATNPSEARDPSRDTPNALPKFEWDVKNKPKSRW